MQHPLKHPCNAPETLAVVRLLYLMVAALIGIPLLAAPRPLTWRADFPSARVENFPVRHGTDVDFRPSWYVNGVPADTNGWTYSLSVQTNGAPAGEWATISGTVVSHTNDCGAEAYNVLVRAVDRDGTVDYSAAARLRMLPSPGFSPGALPPTVNFHESDPVFSTWLSTFTIPETSLEPSTNYTDRALSSFAATGTVFRSASYGTPTRWTDASGRVWEAVFEHFTDWAFSGVPDGYVFWLSDYNGSFPGYSWWLEKEGGGEYYQDVFFAEEPDSTELSIDTHNGITITCTREWVESGTNLVGRVALTNDIPPATDLSPIEQDIADLRTESSLVYRLYSGSNVVAEVTNYNSQVHAPSLRLMQLNESNEYVTVWTETNGLSRTLRDATNYADRAIADYAAPRAWSRTTSGLGADAPPNTTWVSTPRTVIAGGLEYAKVVDTYGEVWVLSSNGMAAEFNPDTNAYFRITADDGTDVFSIEKSDAQVVGADADGITVGAISVTIPVGVVAAEHPTMYWRQSLESGSWADESSPPTGATVTWSGTTGAYVCTVTWSGTRPSSMFFKFTFVQEGGVVIRNHATSDISAGIYVNGVKFVPSVSGNNLIWTKQ